MREFHQLERDLLSYPSKVRPLSSAEQGLAKVEAVHGPGIEDAAKGFLTVLKKVLLAKERRLNVEPHFTDMWPLNPHGCVDWRIGTAAQNRNREWLKVSIFAKLEIDITSTYRAALLQGSLAASFLRTTFKRTMDPFCADRTVEYVGIQRKIATITGWHYADPFTTIDTPTPPLIDLDALLVTREAQQSEQEGRKTLAVFLSKAHAMKIFTASIATKDLDGEIAQLLALLEQVSPCILILTYYSNTINVN